MPTHKVFEGSWKTRVEICLGLKHRTNKSKDVVLLPFLGFYLAHRSTENGLFHMEPIEIPCGFEKVIDCTPQPLIIGHKVIGCLGFS